MAARGTNRPDGAKEMTLSRPLKIGMGIFAFVMLGLLATQIVLLTDQLRTIRTSRAIAERQAARTLPILDAVQPLVGDTRSSLPGLRRGASRLERLVRGATPLVSDLRSARAPEAVRATLALASTLLGARVGATTESLRALAIQREALRHAESLDRKTGPSAPTVTAPVPAGP